MREMREIERDERDEREMREMREREREEREQNTTRAAGRKGTGKRREQRTHHRTALEVELTRAGVAHHRRR